MKKLRPEKRFYRALIKRPGFKSFEVIAGESDVWISVPEKSFRPELPSLLLDCLVSLRTQLLAFGKENPEFLTSLTPVKVPLLAPSIVKKMAEAAKRIGVGPMAGVAGAINYFLGKKLKELGITEFMIENGGDVYVSSSRSVTLALITGVPKLDGKLGVSLPAGEWGVCTSSSKIGHSLSLGNTTIATAICKDPVISDCAATFLGNSRTEEEFIERTDRLKEVEGALGLLNDRFVIRGRVELVRLV
ncbi:UPF0280 family protein [Phorcysia thermohydrogeniphila]|uniref:Uncharacterized protein n=1 Tax=Phorcysia thermohydrogeniphila TaxID=936138 RepID=A0A4R1G8T7_9BACT|nr:UPF0280 family protein [Phorcysia thermohydrogeniphila]TCK04537.1 hypothetical protein CLV27_0969 [Phorcysia thermohydrogeniphila]